MPMPPHTHTVPFVGISCIAHTRCTTCGIENTIGEEIVNMHTICVKGCARVLKSEYKHMCDNKGKETSTGTGTIRQIAIWDIMLLLDSAVLRFSCV